MNKKLLIIIAVILFLAAGVYVFNDLIFKQSLNITAEEYKLTPNVSRVPLTQEKINELNKRKETQLAILKSFPEYYEAYLDLGSIEDELGNFRSAIENYQRAWEIIPGNSTPLLNIAVVYTNVEMYDDAYKAYWQAQKANPKYELVYEKIADFYTRYYQQKKSDIEGLFLNGIDLVDDPTRLMWDLAVYYEENNRLQDSITYLNKYLEIKPGDEMVIQKIQAIQQKAGIK